MDLHLVCTCVSLCLYCTCTVAFFLGMCVNAAVCSFVLGLKRHQLCDASAPVGLSHRLRSLCQTAEEIMLMFLPEQFSGLPN